MKKFLMITITVSLLAGGVNAFAYGINSFTVYDAQDNIVHKITAKSEVNALYLLFQESLQIAADEALFTELPKDAQVLYRYVLSYNYGDDEQYFSFIVYKNYPLCRIPQLQEKEDIPKELTWKLFKYAYEIAGKPAEVKNSFLILRKILISAYMMIRALFYYLLQGKKFWICSTHCLEKISPKSKSKKEI